MTKNLIKQQTNGDSAYRLNRRSFLKIAGSIASVPVLGSLAGCDDSVFLDNMTITALQSGMLLAMSSGNPP